MKGMWPFLNLRQVSGLAPKVHKTQETDSVTRFGMAVAVCFSPLRTRPLRIGWGRGRTLSTHCGIYVSPANEETNGRCSARLKLLLDTPSGSGDCRIQSVRTYVAARTANRANECGYLSLTLWEAPDVARKGKIRLHGRLGNWVGMATAPLREAPLTHDIALSSTIV